MDKLLVNVGETLLMNFNIVIEKFGLENYREILAEEWGDSWRIFPQKGIPFFLTPKYLGEVSDKAGIDGKTIAKLNEIAEKIIADTELSRLAWHIHYLLFISDKGKERNGVEMPNLEKTLGTDTPIFNLLLALSGFKSGEELFFKLGIPNEVAMGSFRDIAIWCDYFREEADFVGINLRVLGWTHQLLYGSLYRLGRLQFGVRPFNGGIHVFRNKTDGKVQALAAGGINFNSAGQYDGVDGIFALAGVWQAEFYRKCGKVIGNPISPLGFAENHLMTLDLAEWIEVLVPGESILDIHIPGGGGMTIESCAEAFAMAKDFFPKYFPGKPFKGYSCHSWLLDIQYETLLPENSNILRFQHEFYLYPIKAGGSENLWRIFGLNGLKNGLAHAPRKSRMQQSVASFLEKEGHLQSGGGFFLLQDLPLGRQIYRSNG